MWNLKKLDFQYIYYDNGTFVSIRKTNIKKQTRPEELSKYQSTKKNNSALHELQHWASLVELDA